MSRTLNLVANLLSTAQHFQTIGRPEDALRILGRLARLADLPPAVAEEIQFRLAEVQLDRQNYQRARRHLTAALLYQPESARYHYLMATALNSEDEGDPERALEHYRKALDIDPDRPECLSEFGLLAVRQGDAEEGLAALRRAAELAPGAPEVLARLVDGLDLLGQSEEACRYLRAAQFRNARDVRFRRLWDDYRFRQLHARQQADRRERLARQTDDGSPAILPFVRPDPGIAPDGARRVRRDAAATGRRPHFGWSAEMPDQKHA